MREQIDFRGELYPLHVPKSKCGSKVMMCRLQAALSTMGPGGPPRLPPTAGLQHDDHGTSYMLPHFTQALEKHGPCPTRVRTGHFSGTLSAFKWHPSILMI